MHIYVLSWAQTVLLRLKIYYSITAALKKIGGFIYPEKVPQICSLFNKNSLSSYIPFSCYRFKGFCKFDIDTYLNLLFSYLTFTFCLLLKNILNHKSMYANFYSHILFITQYKAQANLYV